MTQLEFLIYIARKYGLENLTFRRRARAREAGENFGNLDRRTGTKRSKVVRETKGDP